MAQSKNTGRDFGRVDIHKFINSNNNRFINLAHPVDPNDAATKNYVDGKIFAGEALAGIGLTKTGTTLNLNDNLPNVTGLGTIITGSWEANTIGVPYGGTGRTSFTPGKLVIGNGMSSMSSADGLSVIDTFDISYDTIFKNTRDITGSTGASIVIYGGVNILKTLKTFNLQVGANATINNLKINNQLLFDDLQVPVSTIENLSSNISNITLLSATDASLTVATINNLETFITKSVAIISNSIDSETIYSTSGILDIATLGSVSIDASHIKDAFIVQSESTRTNVIYSNIINATIGELLSASQTSQNLNGVNATLQNSILTSTTIESAFVDTIKATNAEFENIRLSDISIDKTTVDNLASTDIKTVFLTSDSISSESAIINGAVINSLTTGSIDVTEFANVSNIYIQNSTIDSVILQVTTAGSINIGESIIQISSIANLSADTVSINNANLNNTTIANIRLEGGTFNNIQFERIDADYINIKAERDYFISDSSGSLFSVSPSILTIDTPQTFANKVTDVFISSSIYQSVNPLDTRKASSIYVEGAPIDGPMNNFKYKSGMALGYVPMGSSGILNASLLFEREDGEWFSGFYIEKTSNKFMMANASVIGGGGIGINVAKTSEINIGFLENSEDVTYTNTVKAMRDKFVILDTRSATSLDEAPIIVDGGMSIKKNLLVGESIEVQGITVGNINFTGEITQNGFPFVSGSGGSGGGGADIFKYVNTSGTVSYVSTSGSTKVGINTVNVQEVLTVGGNALVNGKLMANTINSGAVQTSSKTVIGQNGGTDVEIQGVRLDHNLISSAVISISIKIETSIDTIIEVHTLDCVYLPSNTWDIISTTIAQVPKYNFDLSATGQLRYTSNTIPNYTTSYITIEVKEYTLGNSNIVPSDTIGNFLIDTLLITNTMNSGFSAGSGALFVKGGATIKKNINIGGNLNLGSTSKFSFSQLGENNASNIIIQNIDLTDPYMISVKITATVKVMLVSSVKTSVHDMYIYNNDGSFVLESDVTGEQLHTFSILVSTSIPQLVYTSVDILDYESSVITLDVTYSYNSSPYEDISESTNLGLVSLDTLEITNLTGLSNTQGNNALLVNGSVLVKDNLEVRGDTYYGYNIYNFHGSERQTAASGVISELYVSDEYSKSFSGKLNIHIVSTNGSSLYNDLMITSSKKSDGSWVILSESIGDDPFATLGTLLTLGNLHVVYTVGNSIPFEYNYISFKYFIDAFSSVDTELDMPIKSSFDRLGLHGIVNEKGVVYAENGFVKTDTSFTYDTMGVSITTNFNTFGNIFTKNEFTGVRNTMPEYTFDVNGDIHASDGIALDGNIYYSHNVYTFNGSILTTAPSGNITGFEVEEVLTKSFSGKLNIQTFNSAGVSLYALYDIYVSRSQTDGWSISTGRVGDDIATLGTLLSNGNVSVTYGVYDTNITNVSFKYIADVFTSVDSVLDIPTNTFDKIGVSGTLNDGGVIYYDNDLATTDALFIYTTNGLSLTTLTNTIGSIIYTKDLKVGVNNTEPAATIDVIGNASINGSVNTFGNIYTDGLFIGINNTSPSSTLDINGILKTTGVNSGDTNTIGSIYTNNGQVGINNTSPNVALDVVGDISISNRLYTKHVVVNQISAITVIDGTILNLNETSSVILLSADDTISDYVINLPTTSDIGKIINISSTKDILRVTYGNTSISTGTFSAINPMRFIFYDNLWYLI